MKINKSVLDLLSLSFVSRSTNSTVGGNLKPDTTETYDLGSTNLRFDNIYAKSVIADTLTGGTGTDHGALIGLADDDHTQYLLADGSRTLSGNLAVGVGVTIDGVDISVLGSDFSTHIGATNPHSITLEIARQEGNTFSGNAYFTGGNKLGIGTSPSYPLHIIATSNLQQLVIRHYSAQTNNMVEFQNDSGTPVSGADARGVLFSASALSGTSTFLGTTAGNIASTVSGTMIGYGVGRYSTGTHNTGVGSYALLALTDGIQNTAVGHQALLALTEGSSNTAVGYYALRSVITASSNVGIGRYAGQAITTNNNTLIGYAAAYNTVGLRVTAIGALAGQGDTGGTENIYLGYDSGSGNVTGDYNTFLGNATTVSSADLNYVIALGRGAVVAASNTMAVGGTGSLAVDTIFGGTTADAKVHITSITEQLRLAYDASNYVSYEVGSGGNLLIKPTGSYITHYNTTGSMYTQVRSYTDSAYLYIQSNYDGAGTATSALVLQDLSNAPKYAIQKDASNDFSVYDYDNTDVFLGYDLSAQNLSLSPLNDIVFAGGNLNRVDSGDFETDTFLSQTTGWHITYTGDADFRYIYADELRVEAFTAAVYMSLVGALSITKSRARLSREFRVPFANKSIVGVDQTDDYFSISGDYSNGEIPVDGKMYVKVTASTGNNGEYEVTDVQYDAVNDETDIYIAIDVPSAVVDGTIFGRYTLYVEDVEGFEDTQVFQNNDWVRLKHMDMSGGGLIVTDIWFTLYGYANETVGDGEQRWYAYAKDDGGIPGDTVNAGAVVLDYGQSGDGVWEATVLDQGNSPYSQVSTWVTDPSVGGNFTTHTRIGNLDGISGFTGAEFGIWAGEGTTNTDGQLIATDQQFTLKNLDISIYSGANEVFVLDRTAPYLALGVNVPTAYNSGTGFFVGVSGASNVMHLGVGSGKRLDYDGTDLKIYSTSTSYIGTSSSNLIGVSGGTQVFLLDSSTGDIILGEVAASKANMAFDTSVGTLSLRINTTTYVQLQADGDVRFGTTAGGNLFYDASASTLYIRESSATVMAFPSSGDATISGTLAVSSPGKITAGGGHVILDTDGVSIVSATTYAGSRSYKMLDGTETYVRGELYALDETGAPSANQVELAAREASGDYSRVVLRAETGSTSQSEIRLIAEKTGQPSATFDLYNDITAGYQYATLTVDELILTNSGNDASLQVPGGIQAGTYTMPATDPGVGNIAATGDIYIGGDEAGELQRRHAGLTPDEDFDVTSAPSGWSEAGSPFVTTGSQSYATDSYVRLYNLASGNRMFYVKSSFVSSTVYYVAGALVATNTGTAFGWRLDDGTDSNYIQYILRVTSSNIWTPRLVSSVGGSVTSYDGEDITSPGEIILELGIGGTRWSSWNPRGRLLKAGSRGIMWAPNSGPSGLSWTPTRMGLYFTGTATWESAYIDWVSW